MTCFIFLLVNRVVCETSFQDLHTTFTKLRPRVLPVVNHSRPTPETNLREVKGLSDTVILPTVRLNDYTALPESRHTDPVTRIVDLYYIISVLGRINIPRPTTF